MTSNVKDRSAIRLVLLSELRLPMTPSSVGIARAYVNLLCDAWSVPDHETAELCVSELTANAITHAHTSVTAMRITATIRGERFRVEVHDPSPTPPEMRQTPLDSESGNGLFLVDAVSADWGHVPTECGKAVWFECHLWGSNA